MEQDLRKIKELSPLVHNITNYVVMNNTANALLAIGASPVMAHAPEETAEMASISSALVVNTGTLSSEWVTGMHLAMDGAKKAGKPIVFDPVGAGATSYRNKANIELISAVHPTIIRGNGSEIMALAQMDSDTRGVDSTAESQDAISAAKKLSQKYGSTVVISGSTDYIIFEDSILENDINIPLMTKVTGMGCTSTALCGAFVAVNPENHQRAAYNAMRLMSLAGEKALEKSVLPGSFQIHFIDALYEISTNLK